MLYSYQQTAHDHLVGVLRQFPAAVDASDTGTGKTFVALMVAKTLGLAPLVLCPKSVITAWRDVASTLEVPLTDVLNYERIKTGKTPYVSKGNRKGEFIWAPVPMIIADEVQKCSGYRSQNASLLALTKSRRIPVLMLSATVADSPLKLRAPGYLLGLHNYRDHYNWCLQHGCFVNPWNGIDFVRGKNREVHLKRIHQAIFPTHGVRVRIADISDFPETSIQAEAYDMSQHAAEIQEVYDALDEELRTLQHKSKLTAMLRARQRTELLKVPMLNELTRDFLEEGKSVVLFISFRDTLTRLLEALPDDPVPALIYGDQPQKERDNEIARFQTDEARVCIVMVQAGGVGLSLHDVRGEFPRVSLITPTYSAVELKQALGRIHRAGAKSKSLQKIIFAANTIEAAACRAVRRKLENISALNDGDLTAGILEE